nr:hypothetical protein [Anaerolineae bacterium]
MIICRFEGNAVARYGLIGGKVAYRLVGDPCAVKPKRGAAASASWYDLRLG